MRLRIMEYNVQDFFLHLEYPLAKEDGAVLTDEQWQLLGRSDVFLKPLSKIKAIAAIINEVSPDIICFCEMGGQESLEIFNRIFLDDTYIPYLLPGNSSRGIESGFLVRKSLPLTHRIRSHSHWPVPFRYPHEQDPVTFRLAAEAAQYYDLGHPDHRRLSRDIPALFLEDSSGVRLVVLLVHLKSGFDTAGVDLDGKVRRGAELKALLSIYHSLLKELDAETPILFAGDFNGKAGRNETASEFLPLYEHDSFEDVLEICQVAQYERISQLTFIRSHLIAQQLDFIFVPKRLAKIVENAYIYRYRFADDQTEIMLPSSFRDRSQLPSDHYPLVCDLDLTSVRPSPSPNTESQTPAK